LKKEWDQKWLDYKDIQFETLSIDDMQNDADDQLAKLRQLAKDQREYKVFEFVNHEILKFTQTMPIIQSI
jgi:hypothetical protein